MSEQCTLDKPCGDYKSSIRTSDTIHLDYQIPFIERWANHREHFRIIKKAGLDEDNNVDKSDYIKP